MDIYLSFLWRPEPACDISSQCCNTSKHLVSQDGGNLVSKRILASASNGNLDFIDGSARWCGVKYVFVFLMLDLSCLLPVPAKKLRSKLLLENLASSLVLNVLAFLVFILVKSLRNFRQSDRFTHSYIFR